MKKILAWLLVVFSFAFISIGYAQVADVLILQGTADVEAGSSHDIYIKSMAPKETESVSITDYVGTTFSASVTGSNASTFTVTVYNQSDKFYVFERVIDGAELDIEGVYSGDGINYTLSGINYLQEVGPGEEFTFTTTITASKNVVTDYYMLKYNFIEKSDIGVLPGTPDPIYYTVTFVGADVPTQSVLQNNIATEPQDPQKSGYVFAGWYLEGKLYDFATPVKSNITLEAKWIEETPEAIYHTVTFTGADVPAQSVLDGTRATRPADPTRYAFAFVAWYLNGVVYDFSAPVTSDITLEAIWVEAIPEVYYTVSFSGADIPTQTVLKGTFATKPTDPARDGYVFDGWHLDGKPYDFNVGVTGDITLVATWKVGTVVFYDDFYGLVQALLSSQSNCLNSGSHVIVNAVENAYYNSKRGDDVAILHCSTNAIKGGNMSNIAITVNKNLSQNVQFYLEPEILADGSINPDRMFLYMYYGSVCTSKDVGKTILVCKQVLSRDANGIWYADGTYMGKAVVGYHYGGGQNGKDVLTTIPTSWTYGAP